MHKQSDKHAAGKSGNQHERSTESCAILRLEGVDLHGDVAAARYVKNEVVEVTFARGAGSLISLEGPNHYREGDALIEAPGGERWVVSRDRFEDKYVPAAPQNRMGEDGPFRNRPVAVLGKQMTRAFTIARVAGGDWLTGAPGDWLLQYAPGDYGVVQQARFARVYRLLVATAEDAVGEATGHIADVADDAGTGTLP